MVLYLIKLIKDKFKILKSQKELYQILLVAIMSLYFLALYITLIQQEYNLIKAFNELIPFLIFFIAIYTFTVFIDLICGFEIRTFHFGTLSEVLERGLLTKAKKIPFFIIDTYIIFFGISLSFALIYNPFLSSTNLDLSKIIIIIINQLIITLVYTVHVVSSLDRYHRENLEIGEE